MSYYTTYRPQTIAELDLVGVRSQLETILSSGKFSHAYLFTGPKGTGKTSSARILAKVLNCEKNKNHGNNSLPPEGGSPLKRESHLELFEPCNKCDNCRRITNGSSLSCLEMDAASNRGIDDIRTLKERIGLSPAEGHFTVYIIDEVHMLTTEAFNALLKTLEEPPAHAVFALCTTDPQKIPDTVISRCTRVLFQKASIEEVVHSLNKAVLGEKLTVDDGVLEAIARRVDGSFRDGMKTLEQASQAGKQITVSLIDEMTGYGNDYAVNPLIASLLDKDVKKALTELHAKQEMGIDVGVFAKRLVEELRRMMLESIMSGKNDSSLTTLTDKAATMAVSVKQAVIPVLPLEIMIAEWCVSGNNTPSPVVRPPQPPPVQRIQKEEKVVVEKVIVKEPEKIEHTPPMNAYTGTSEEVIGRWQEILAAIKPLNHSLEALLKSAHPVGVVDGWLTIEAYYKFHKEQLEQDKYRKQLESVIGSLLGGNVLLRFVLGTTPTKQAVVSLPSPQDDVLAQAAEEIFGK